jgi:hypothetical protein
MSTDGGATMSAVTTLPTAVTKSGVMALALALLAAVASAASAIKQPLLRLVARLVCYEATC